MYSLDKNVSCVIYILINYHIATRKLTVSNPDPMHVLEVYYY